MGNFPSNINDKLTVSYAPGQLIGVLT